MRWVQGGAGLPALRLLSTRPPARPARPRPPTHTDIEQAVLGAEPRGGGLLLISSPQPLLVAGRQLEHPQLSHAQPGGHGLEKLGGVLEAGLVGGLVGGLGGSPRLRICLCVVAQLASTGHVCTREGG